MSTKGYWNNFCTLLLLHFYYSFSPLHKCKRRQKSAPHRPTCVITYILYKKTYKITVLKLPYTQYSGILKSMFMQIALLKLLDILDTFNLESR